MGHAREGEGAGRCLVFHLTSAGLLLAAFTGVEDLIAVVYVVLVPATEDNGFGWLVPSVPGDSVLGHPMYAGGAQRLSTVEVLAYMNARDFTVCHAVVLRVWRR
jgi:hypothetical protein